MSISSIYLAIDNYGPSDPYATSGFDVTGAKTLRVYYSFSISGTGSSSVNVRGGSANGTNYFNVSGLKGNLWIRFYVVNTCSDTNVQRATSFGCKSIILLY